MGKHYRIGESADNRRIRTEVIIAVLVAIAVIVGLAVVIFDLNKNKVVIDDTENTAILGRVESSAGGVYKIENEQYEVYIPNDWKQVNNPEIIVDGSRYYPDRYQGLTGHDVGRRLDVYVDTIPANLGVSKVVSVKGVANKIAPLQTSPQCYKFTDFPKEQPGDDYPSSWEGIDFTCSTLEQTNVLGAIENNQTTGVKLDSINGTTDFFLIYTDHGSRIDNSIFTDILESFKAK